MTDNIITFPTKKRPSPPQGRVDDLSRYRPTGPSRYDQFKTLPYVSEKPLPARYVPGDPEGNARRVAQYEAAMARHLKDKAEYEAAERAL